MTSFEKEVLIPAIFVIVVGFGAGLIWGKSAMAIGAPFVAAAVSCHAMYLHVFNRRGVPKHESPPDAIEMALFSWGTAAFIGLFSIIPMGFGVFLNGVFF